MDCIFCKIIKKEIPSKGAYEDDLCVAFHDINPAAPTHLLIVPKKHFENIASMTDADKGLIGHLHGVARDLAKKNNLTDFRIVSNNGAAAGQSVWHLHLHLLGGRSFSWPPG